MPAAQSNMNNIEFKDIDKFIKREFFIASGQFGVIYQGKYKNKDVAIKEVIRSRDEMQEVDLEIEILRTIRHANVIEFYGYASENLKLYLVMEFMDGGSLHKVVHDSNVSYELQEIINWICQAVKGLVALHTHTRSVIHRDVKPLNMLLDKSRKILKICDFGLGRFFATNMTKRTGTYIYMAPEVLAGTRYNQKCDVYSLGITIWEVFSSKVPYYNQERKRHDIIDDVCKKSLRPDLTDLRKDCPNHIKTLITNCWNHLPNERPTMEEILKILTND